MWSLPWLPSGCLSLSVPSVKQLLNQSETHVLLCLFSAVETPILCMLACWFSVLHINFDFADPFILNFCGMTLNFMISCFCHKAATYHTVSTAPKCFFFQLQQIFKKITWSLYLITDTSLFIVGSNSHNSWSISLLTSALGFRLDIRDELNH